MFQVLSSRVSCVALAIAGVVWLTGCATAPVETKSKPAPAAPAAPVADSPAVLQARFERLVQRLLDVEPDVTSLLDRLGSAADKPAQVAVERELLKFLESDAFANALKSDSFFTLGTLMQQFSPQGVATLKNGGLDRALLKVVDELGRLSAEISNLATLSEDGRALSRIFTLVHHDVLPAMVESRALVTEEHLDANEGAALAQKVEEQLQSINEQLRSLQSRAQSVSSPTSPP